MSNGSAKVVPTLGIALVFAGLASGTPAFAAESSVRMGGVTYITATPAGHRCVRFRWGGTTLHYFERYAVKIRGNNDGNVFRWGGRKKHLTVCKFPVNAYSIWVRKTGTPWVRISFEVGNPQIP